MDSTLISVRVRSLKMYIACESVNVLCM